MVGFRIAFAVVFVCGFMSPLRAQSKKAAVAPRKPPAPPKRPQANPARELDRFDAAVLDPPRAGALAQAKMLNRSGIKRIAYVSCDAASFARDGRVLTDGGFRLDRVLGVDQFLWSAHIELVASFARD